MTAGESETARRVLRPDLVHALGWRLIAELLRRHHALIDLRIFNYFPLQDPWGVMQLAPLGGPDESGPGITLSIGGNLPGAWIIGPFAQPRLALEDLSWPERNWALGILAATDPKSVVDDLEAIAGLPASKPGSSTPPVLAARVIAEFLGRRALGRERWRASCAVTSDVDSMGLATWAKNDAWISDQLVAVPAERFVIPARFWLVHRLGPSTGPAGSLRDIRGKCMALDFKTGRVWDPTGVGEPIDLAALYQQLGRKLTPVVAGLETLFEAEA